MITVSFNGCFGWLHRPSYGLAAEIGVLVSVRTQAALTGRFGNWRTTLPTLGILLSGSTTPVQVTAWTSMVANRGKRGSKAFMSLPSGCVRRSVSAKSCSLACVSAPCYRRWLPSSAMTLSASYCWSRSCEGGRTSASSASRRSCEAACPQTALGALKWVSWF